MLVLEGKWVLDLQQKHYTKLLKSSVYALPHCPKGISKSVSGLGCRLGFQSSWGLCVWRVGTSGFRDSESKRQNPTP